MGRVEGQITPLWNRCICSLIYVGWYGIVMRLWSPRLFWCRTNIIPSSRLCCPIIYTEQKDPSSSLFFCIWLLLFPLVEPKGRQCICLHTVSPTHQLEQTMDSSHLNPESSFPFPSSILCAHTGNNNNKIRRFPNLEIIIFCSSWDNVFHVQGTGVQLRSSRLSSQFPPLSFYTGKAEASTPIPCTETSALTCPWDGNHLGRTGRLGQINTQISILPVSNWDMKNFGPFWGGAFWLANLILSCDPCHLMRLLLSVCLPSPERSSLPCKKITKSYVLLQAVFCCQDQILGLWDACFSEKKKEGGVGEGRHQGVNAR